MCCCYCCCLAFIICFKFVLKVFKKMGGCLSIFFPPKKQRRDDGNTTHKKRKKDTSRLQNKYVNQPVQNLPKTQNLRDEEVDISNENMARNFQRNVGNFHIANSKSTPLVIYHNETHTIKETGKKRLQPTVKILSGNFSSSSVPKKPLRSQPQYSLSRENIDNKNKQSEGSNIIHPHRSSVANVKNQNVAEKRYEDNMPPAVPVKVNIIEIDENQYDHKNYGLKPTKIQPTNINQHTGRSIHSPQNECFLETSFDGKVNTKMREQKPQLQKNNVEPKNNNISNPNIHNGIVQNFSGQSSKPNIDQQNFKLVPERTYNSNKVYSEPGGTNATLKITKSTEFSADARGVGLPSINYCQPVEKDRAKYTSESKNSNFNRIPLNNHNNTQLSQELNLLKSNQDNTNIAHSYHYMLPVKESCTPLETTKDKSQNFEDFTKASTKKETVYPVRDGEYFSQMNKDTVTDAATLFQYPSLVKNERNFPPLGYSNKKTTVSKEFKKPSYISPAILSFPTHVSNSGFTESNDETKRSTNIFNKPDRNSIYSIPGEHSDDNTVTLSDIDFQNPVLENKDQIDKNVRTQSMLTKEHAFENSHELISLPSDITSSTKTDHIHENFKTDSGNEYNIFKSTTYQFSSLNNNDSKTDTSNDGEKKSFDNQNLNYGSKVGLINDQEEMEKNNNNNIADLMELLKEITESQLESKNASVSGPDGKKLIPEESTQAYKKTVKNDPTKEPTESYNHDFGEHCQGNISSIRYSQSDYNTITQPDPKQHLVLKNNDQIKENVETDLENKNEIISSSVDEFLSSDIKNFLTGILTDNEEKYQSVNNQNIKYEIEIVFNNQKEKINNNTLSNLKEFPHDNNELELESKHASVLNFNRKDLCSEESSKVQEKLDGDDSIKEFIEYYNHDFKEQNEKNLFPTFDNQPEYNTVTQLDLKENLISKNIDQTHENIKIDSENKNDISNSSAQQLLLQSEIKNTFASGLERKDLVPEEPNKLPNKIDKAEFIRGSTEIDDHKLQEQNQKSISFTYDSHSCYNTTTESNLRQNFVLKNESSENIKIDLENKSDISRASGDQLLSQNNEDSMISQGITVVNQPLKYESKVISSNTQKEMEIKKNTAENLMEFSDDENEDKPDSKNPSVPALDKDDLVPEEPSKKYNKIDKGDTIREFVLAPKLYQSQRSVDEDLGLLNESKCDSLENSNSQKIFREALDSKEMLVTTEAVSHHQKTKFFSEEKNHIQSESGLHQIEPNNSTLLEDKNLKESFMDKEEIFSNLSTCNQNDIFFNQQSKTEVINKDNKVVNDLSEDQLYISEEQNMTSNIHSNNDEATNNTVKEEYSENIFKSSKAFERTKETIIDMPDPLDERSDITEETETKDKIDSNMCHSFQEELSEGKHIDLINTVEFTEGNNQRDVESNTDISMKDSIQDNYAKIDKSIELENNKVVYTNSALNLQEDKFNTTQLGITHMPSVHTIIIEERCIVKHNNINENNNEICLLPSMNKNNSKLPNDDKKGRSYVYEDKSVKRFKFDKCSNSYLEVNAKANEVHLESGETIDIPHLQNEEFDKNREPIVETQTITADFLEHASVIENTRSFIDNEQSCSLNTETHVKSQYNLNNVKTEESVLTNAELENKEVVSKDVEEIKTEEDKECEQTITNLPSIESEHLSEDIIDPKIYDSVIRLLEEIRQKAVPFEDEIKRFTELEDSNKYYYIEESLRRLVDKLDDMFDEIGENRSLRDERKKVYKYIFPLFDRLDDKVEENKKRILEERNKRI